jgi:hypothetical protein
MDEGWICLFELAPLIFWEYDFGFEQQRFGACNEPPDFDENFYFSIAFKGRQCRSEAF